VPPSHSGVLIGYIYEVDGLWIMLGRNIIDYGALHRKSIEKQVSVNIVMFNDEIVS